FSEEANRENGFKYITNFTPRDYNGGTQNFSILQDKDGVIYVGNQEGLLQYDGLSWRVLEIPNSYVLSLAKDNSGTIFAGGNKEFGFLKADSQGELRYESLMNHLREDQKKFSTVWETYCTGEGVYLRVGDSLYRWDAGDKMLSEITDKVNGAFYCNERLFIRRDTAGLMEMINGQLTLVQGGEKFADKEIYMMAPYDNQKLLVGTRSDGLYIYDGKEAYSLPTKTDEFIKKNEINCVIRLSSGDFAIATQRGGIVIIGSHGNLKYIFNEAAGLQDNYIRNVLQDKQGNLWLAMNKGISKIEYNSPISILDDRSKLDGLVQTITRHGAGNILYVGTDTGLYYFKPPLTPTRPGEFHQVTGMSSMCYSLLSIDGSLLAATEKGLFQVANSGHIELIKNSSYVLAHSGKDKNRIWVGTNKGLFSLYRQNDRWKNEGAIGDSTRKIRTIAEDVKGNLWLGSLSSGVLNVDFSSGTRAITRPLIKIYDSRYGLPDKQIRVFRATDHIMFATDHGIFRFDGVEKRFFPDSTFGDEFEGGPAESSGAEVYRIVEDKEKNVWIHSEQRNIRAVRRSNGAFQLEKAPFLRITPAKVNAIYPDPDGNIVWFGGTDGLIRFDKRVIKDYDAGFKTLIRKVIVNGNPVFNGYESGSILPPVEYENRNLRFEFAATFFEGEDQTEYRYRLDDYDDNWSHWTPETLKDYTNVDSGAYVFRVQARNIYRGLGGEAVFKFEVLRPWYKTWWAFVLYIVPVFLAVYFIFIWRSGKLEREKQRLEKIVEKRTSEIKEKNQQLEDQTIRLKEQAGKLKEMDQVKSRFFANISHEFRTPLTLIMGPLEQMLSDPGENQRQRTVNRMLRNSQRLLGLINQLLELSKFESGKIKLQAGRQDIIPFLKGIAVSFDQIAECNDLELIFSSPEPDITLYFDPVKLAEAVTNLISNAIKFTPPGGRITITTSSTGETGKNFPSGSVDISFSDTGPGIPRQQLEHIFDRFYQCESSHEHPQKGTGIGLSIAKEVIELHRGTINAHSREGVGTEFIIRLPLGDGHLEPGEIVATPEPHLSPEIPIEADRENDPEAVREEAAENTAAETEPDPLEQGKDTILVVEDNSDMRDYIRESLEPDYIVIEAADGRKGIETAMEIIPDIIISDIMMPEADGHELCRTLKNDIKTSHIPIILLTAKASEESILQGLETGADDYVTKPFNTKILYARVKNLIELRHNFQRTIHREMDLQPAKMSVSHKDKQFIKKLKTLLKKNIADPDFNINQLCKEMDMPQPTLYRK
ncbi:MAG: response regulator, partial [bacterium]|nr:response regulator [bacterium]